MKTNAQTREFMDMARDVLWAETQMIADLRGVATGSSDGQVVTKEVLKPKRAVRQRGSK